MAVAAFQTEMTQSGTWALPVHCELGPTRHWLRRGALRHLFLAGATTIFYGIAMALFLLLARADESPAVGALRVLLAVITIGAFAGTVGLAVLAARWFSLVIHGYPPRLRLSARGIDIRYYTDFDYDLTFPWGEIERVELKVVWWRPYLCITPKGPHRWIPDDPLRAATVEKCFQTYGAPFVVSLRFIGVDFRELDRLLRHYSGARFGVQGL